MAKKSMKPPKMKKGYADGGPISEFSYDDYYKRLNAWKEGNAQNVPQDIAEYQSKWIVPQIKDAQVALNAALAKKYGLQPGQAPKPNQALTKEEAEAVMGKDGYNAYLTSVKAYQAYRDKTAGSYKAPASTAGAFDSGGDMYGPRHFGMFTLSDAQKKANVATTKAAGKPTSQEQANKQAGVTTPAPAATPALAGTATPVDTQTPAAPAQATDAAPAPAAPKYQKYVTNFGQTYYYKDGKQVTPQAYNTGVTDPNAQVYLLDESTGIYDENGNPKQPVLQTPQAPAPEKKEQAPPKMKKGGTVGGKKKKYANGGVIAPDTLNPEQLKAFNAFATDEERQAYLDSLTGDASALTPMQKAMGQLAPVAGQLASAGVDMIEVDPLNKNQNIAKGAASGALKGAGTGTMIGMNPLLMAATGGLSAPIGAVAGALVGGTAGGIKGKKKYSAAKSVNQDANRNAALNSTYTDAGYADGGKVEKKSTGMSIPDKKQSNPSVYKDGGKVKGPGTAKSDDVPAKVRKGSFIVPAENAKMAELLRKKYLTKEGGDAKLKQSGNTDNVKLSNGEHMFTPEEVEILKTNGIDVDALAPNAETTGYGYADGGEVDDHGDPAEVKKEYESLQTQYNVEKDPAKKKEIQAKIKALQPNYDYWRTHPDEAAQKTFEKTFSVKEGDQSSTAGDAGKPVTSGAPKSTGGAGTGTGTGSAKATQKDDPNFDSAAYQAAFLKEHGGVGSGGTETPAEKKTESESRFKAVATDPVDELLKKYDELLNSGKIGEANAIEKQINDLGGQKRLTDYKTKAATASAMQKTFTPQATGMEAMESEDAVVDKANGVVDSPLSRVYNTLGPGALLGMGQAAIGLTQSATNKAPDYSKIKGDATLIAQRDQALREQNYGLSPAEYSNAANRIESQRANVARTIGNVSGGDIGAMVGNARQAAIDTNRARLDLEAADQRMKLAKQSRADQLINAASNDRNRVFAENMNMFNQRQMSSAQLINAGLANMVGSISFQANQDRIDQRAAKYGQINLTLAP